MREPSTDWRRHKDVPRRLLPLCACSLLVLSVFVAACAGADDDAASEVQRGEAVIEPGESSDQHPIEITCHMQYRPTVGRSDGEQQAALVVTRDDTLGLSAEEQLFATLGLRVSYAGEVPDDPYSVLLGVGSQDVHVWTGRFAAPRSDDSSAHGFTGLNYIEYEGSELQVWCVPGDG